MSALKFPRKLTFHLPDGGVLTAKLIQPLILGREDEREDATYRIKCVGQTLVLQDFVEIMCDGREREILIDILKLEPDNPTIIYHEVVTERRKRDDGGYDLTVDEVKAIIIRSRAMIHGEMDAAGTSCARCDLVEWELGEIGPFIECTRMAMYDRIAVTCPNCLWRGSPCDIAP